MIVPKGTDSLLWVFRALLGYQKTIYKDYMDPYGFISVQESDSWIPALGLVMGWQD